MGLRPWRKEEAHRRVIPRPREGMVAAISASMYVYLDTMASARFETMTGTQTSLQVAAWRFEGHRPRKRLVAIGSFAGGLEAAGKHLAVVGK